MEIEQNDSFVLQAIDWGQCDRKLAASMIDFHLAPTACLLLSVTSAWLLCRHLSARPEVTSTILEWWWDYK